MAYIPFSKEYHHDHSQLMFERIIGYIVQTNKRLKIFKTEKDKHHTGYRIAISPFGSSLFTGPICSSVYFLLDQCTTINNLIMIADSGYNDAIIHKPSYTYTSYHTGLGKKITINHAEMNKRGNPYGSIIISDIHIKKHDITAQMPYISALSRIKSVCPLYIGRYVSLEQLMNIHSINNDHNTGVVFCTNMSQHKNDSNIVAYDTALLSNIILNSELSQYRHIIDDNQEYNNTPLMKIGLEYGYHQGHYMDCILYSYDEEKAGIYQSYGSFIG